MNSPLDARLRRLQQERTPDLHARFNASVWAKIGMQRVKAAAPWWMFWPEPQLVLAAAALAVVVGFGAGTLAPPKPPASSFGMEVFSPAAPHRPATLLTRLK